nr:hypothetical protein [Tanacetum cinerariifolium]
IPFDPKRYYKDGAHTRMFRRPRSVNRVHVLDFAGLTDGMRQSLRDRLSMVYAGDDRQAVFTSYAWRRETGLDVADTLCFQLGEARRRMTWRQFILALGLHSEEEMAEPGFRAYWAGRHRVKKVIRVDLFYLQIMDGTANVSHLLAHYLFYHAEGRKSGARLSGGHFIGCLAVPAPMQAPQLLPPTP